MLGIIVALSAETRLSYQSHKGVNLQRYAPVPLSFLAGFLFSNPVYADQPPLEALVGETKTVDSGLFTLTSTPFSGVLSANGGTITAAPALPGVTPALTLDAPTLQGADVRNGGKISIPDAKFTVSAGLRVATGGGTIDATNLEIVLGPGGTNGAGAQVAGSTITLHGGSITSAPGSVIQSTGVLAQDHATLIANGTNISGSFRNSAQATNIGHIQLSNLSITQNHVSSGPAFGALETSTGGTISANHVTINTGTPLNRGAYVQGGRFCRQTARSQPQQIVQTGYGLKSASSHRSRADCQH